MSRGKLFESARRLFCFSFICRIIVNWVEPRQERRGPCTQTRTPTAACAGRGCGFRYLALSWLRPLLSWRGYAQVLAYLSCELVGDLGVSRNSRGPLRFPIDVDGVPAAFSQELAALTFQVLQQSPALHAPIGSRTTSSPSNSRRVNSLLASRTSFPATRRLSRHSSRLSPWAFAP